MNVILHIDGGARGNPGPAAIGVVVHDIDSSAPLHEAGYLIGNATNNVAEYSALVRGLEIVRTLHPQGVEIRSDSELLVRQISGQYRVKSPIILPLYQRARKYLDQIKQWNIEHVRREENRRADELVNLALDAGNDVIDLSSEGFEGAVPTDNPALETPVPPSWEARFQSSPGSDCPAAKSQTSKAFRFGPTTPQGCCIHAAEAVLKRTLHHNSPPNGTVDCTRCGVLLKITPA